MQEFEKYKALSNHIERMACTGNTGGVVEWSSFLTELNTCFLVLESRITELEDALEKIYDSPNDNDGIIDISFDALNSRSNT